MPRGKSYKSIATIVLSLVIFGQLRDYQCHRAKYVPYCNVVQDLKGEADVFFTYTGRVFEMNKAMLRVAMGKSTIEAELEDMRGMMVCAMRGGETFCILLGESECPDFHKEWTSPQIFDANTVFNKAAWCDNTNRTYLQFLKEHENVGPGGLNKGCFFVHDDFNIVICTQSEDPTVVAKIHKNLPHFRYFSCFTVY